MSPNVAMSTFDAPQRRFNNIYNFYLSFVAPEIDVMHYLHIKHGNRNVIYQFYIEKWIQMKANAMKKQENKQKANITDGFLIFFSFFISRRKTLFNK